VRLRWVFTDQPFLPLGTNCVINNRVWNEDQDSDLVVGQLPLGESRYRQDARWVLPEGRPVSTPCHAEWLAVGEPWPTALAPMEYDVYHIPFCCGCALCCNFVGCSLDPVNEQAASQQRQYAIDQALVDDDTPFWTQNFLLAYTDAPAVLRGTEQALFPLGANGAMGYGQTILATDAGVMESANRLFQIDADESTAERIDAAGWQVTHKSAGVDSVLSLTRVGAVGSLGGSNLKIDPSIMPDGLIPRTKQTLAAAGTTQATAGAITGTNVICSTNPPANSGLRLPAAFVPTTYIAFRWATTANPVKIYPPVGGTINLGALNAPITVTPAGIGTIELWCAVPLNVTSSGGDWRVYKEM
jgi:hypothetical protein